MKEQQSQEQLPKLPIGILLKDVWKWIRPYRVRFIIASTLRLASDIASLYPPLALAFIITFLSQYKPGQDTYELWTTFIFLIAATGWRLVTIHAGRVMCYFIGERVSLDVQLAANKHLFSLPASWHEQENTGNKLKRITRGGESYQKLTRIWIQNVIEICVNFIGISWIILHIDPLLAGLLAFFSLIYYIIARTLIKPAAQAAHQANICEEEYTGLSFEALNNIRSVQVYGSWSLLLNRVRAMIDTFYTAICKRLWKFTVRNMSLETWQWIFRMFALTVIITGIVSGRYELGLFVAFSWYFNAISESVRELADISQEYVIARLSIQRLNTIMNERPANWNDTNALAFPLEWKRIAFRNVSFSYSGQQVLDDVSFEVKRGERIGIVGLSGAGKSTLFKLMMKEYENYNGDIFFDAFKLRSLSRGSFFKRVAVVLQETEVFNFSLKDNIALARPDDAVDVKALEECIEVAHISDFLHKLPLGIDTHVGEKGVKLSGGEKQRLGIARAIYKQPDLLLLDEATSHLDLESEEKIQDSLHQFFKKVTAIVIAHRLTTIKEMDRIIVLENGKIVEEGTFAQLHRKKGRFHELWEKQKL
ncbi:MAG: ABC transporter ATP-binding protein [Patescibacteria group bacterium]